MKSLIVLCATLFALTQASRFKYDDDEMMMADGWKEGDNMVSLNWDTECDDKVNDLIQAQLESTFQSIAIATFFRRHDVDIIGMSLMYNAWARQKINVAKDLMMYLVKRGSSPQFHDIPKPKKTQWADPANALVLSLRNERQIAEKINELAHHARTHNDVHLLGFIEENLINQQSDNVFEVASLINKLSKGGEKLGLMAINGQMVKKYRDYKDCSNDTEKYKWNY